MWPFKGSGRHGQTPAEARAEVIELRDLLIESEEARNWFHDRWVEASEQVLRLGEAELFARHAMDQIDELKKIIAALEEIAGPYVPAAKTNEPIYAALRAAETTQEIRIPASTGVVSLAKAVLVGAL